MQISTCSIKLNVIQHLSNIVCLITVVCLAKLIFKQNLYPGVWFDAHFKKGVQKKKNAVSQDCNKNVFSWQEKK